MTTTQGAIRRLELLLARTPDMECADDLRVVLADAVLSRAELEAAKQWGVDLSNELTHRTTKLTEARRLLDDARAQKPVLCVPASIANDVAHIAARGQFDAAIEVARRYSQPFYAAAPVPAQPASPAIAAYMAAGGDEERDPIERLRFYLSCALKGRDWHDVEPFIDAISKAQPAAVPEAVEFKRVVELCWRIHANGVLGNGKGTYDAISELRGILSAGLVPEAVAKDAAPSCFTCIHSAKDDEDYPCRSCRMMSHWSSAALLSAADTEVKK
jgi:hypothetical protein